MVNIEIGFTARDTFAARLIRRLTNSRVNHVFLICDFGSLGDKWVLHADEKGVRIIPLERVISGKVYDVERYGSLMDLSPGVVAMRKYIGAKYDWKGVLWGVFRLCVWKLCGEKIAKPVHCVSRMFCSELVASVLKESKVPGTELWEPANMTPEDIRRFVTMSVAFKE